MNEIDEILKALGGAETPAGLEERVLRRLAAVPARRGSPWRAWSVAGGMALAAAVVCGVTWQHHAQPAVPGAAPRDVAQQVPEFMPNAKVQTTVTMANLWNTPTRRAQPPLLPVRPLAVGPASFPAPPMPLTDQEKSLMAIARSKDLPTFAPMNPENRDELIAQGKAEFDQFFPQPKPQETYYETHLLEQ